jgi:phosphoribosylamine--glycine ligase
MAKVLVIGSGGREHALAWKLGQSPKVDKVYVAPGNGGTALVAENVPIGFTDVDGLLKFAQENRIDFTVIGQEAASAAGVVDAFQNAGLAIFGPTKSATRIESSKAFSKDLMQAEQIPTAQYQNFDDPETALAYAKTRSYPLVIKADGLAEGKGVTIAENFDQASAAINKAMVDKVFGDSGNQVVIEDFLKGAEVSVHALTDGQTAVIFPTSQDHKQVFDGDTGPNTGGMGVIAPVPWVTDQHMATIDQKIVQPALAGLRKQGALFVGCLYPGLMIDGADVNVVEFNSRFGDPECEAYMRLFEGDLYEVLLACSKGELNMSSVSWKAGFVAVVAVASGGYPGSYEKGKVITGIKESEEQADVVVFHAGTKQEGDEYQTSGGRVLYVTTTGDTLDQAILKAYKGVEAIQFEGMQYRSDIGRRPAPQ